MAGWSSGWGGGGSGGVTPADGPYVVSPPTLSGTPQTGAPFTATTAVTTGSPTPTPTYQWKAGGVNGTGTGATTLTYTPVSGDVGSTLTITETDTNATGAISSTSSASSAVTAATAPANTVAPAITGTAKVGQTLTCSTGTWTGSPTPTYAYQWKSAGTNISGATASTYVPVTGDIGNTITCAVTATNSQGSASATSAATGAVIAASVTSIAFNTSVASSAATVTAPSGVIAGDILVLHDFSDASSGSPTAVVPTGFTQIGNVSDGGTKRQITSYKLAGSGDASSVITGMNANKNDKILLVFRPNAAAITLTLGSPNSQGSSSAPTNQTITASGGTPPLVALGFWASNGVVSSRAWTITGDGEVHGAGVNNQLWTGYKIYNSSPVDSTVSMADYGQNCLASCYIGAA